MAVKVVWADKTETTFKTAIKINQNEKDTVELLNYSGDVKAIIYLPATKYVFIDS